MACLMTSLVLYEIFFKQLTKTVHTYFLTVYLITISIAKINNKDCDNTKYWVEIKWNDHIIIFKFCSDYLVLPNGCGSTTRPLSKDGSAEEFCGEYGDLTVGPRPKSRRPEIKDRKSSAKDGARRDPDAGQPKRRWARSHRCCKFTALMSCRLILLVRSLTLPERWQHKFPEGSDRLSDRSPIVFIIITNIISYFNK